MCPVLRGRPRNICFDEVSQRGLFLDIPRHSLGGLTDRRIYLTPLHPGLPGGLQGRRVHRRASAGDKLAGSARTGVVGWHKVKRQLLLHGRLGIAHYLLDTTHGNPRGRCGGQRLKEVELFFLGQCSGLFSFWCCSTIKHWHICSQSDLCRCFSPRGGLRSASGPSADSHALWTTSNAASHCFWLNFCSLGDIDSLRSRSGNDRNLGSGLDNRLDNRLDSRLSAHYAVRRNFTPPERHTLLDGGSYIDIFRVRCGLASAKRHRKGFLFWSCARILGPAVERTDNFCIR